MTERMTMAEALAEKSKRPNKYGAVKTVVDGITFDSKAEAKRWQQLKVMEQAGEIHSIVRQPVFPLYVNGNLVCKYVADFKYLQRSGGLVVEDVKGVRTAVYILKRKLVKAIYGIDILEI